MSKEIIFTEKTPKAVGTYVCNVKTGDVEEILLGGLVEVECVAQI